MRDLLFLCHRIPYPPDKGDKIRAFHLLERLRQSFRIHLGCFIDDPADQAYVDELATMVTSLACIPLSPKRARLRALTRLRPGMPLSVEYFHDARLSAWVAETAVRHPIKQIFVFCSAMAPYADMVQGVPRVLDMVDIDSEKFAAYAQTASWPARLIWKREARTLLAFERAAAQRFDRTLFVSPAEHARFVTLAPEAATRSGWIANGVDLQRFAPEHQFESPFTAAEPAVVFTGAMDYRPNIEAVQWFADVVLPSLMTRRPAPVFYIVGTNPAASVRVLGKRPNIRVTGRVPDTRPYLAHAALVVAPLRIGRGVQNKVLEAMAMGRPVIASPEAFSGINGQPGHDLLVADGAASMIRLAQDVLDGGYPHLGEHARQTMCRGYDWEQTLAPLDALVGVTQTSAMPAIQVHA